MDRLKVSGWDAKVTALIHSRHMRLQRLRLACLVGLSELESKFPKGGFIGD